MNYRNYFELINYEYPKTCIFLLTYCHNDAQNAQPLHFLYIYQNLLEQKTHNPLYLFLNNLHFLIYSY